MTTATIKPLLLSQAAQQASRPKYQISQSESAAITAFLNQLRATTPIPAAKMKRMTWDTSLEQAMKNYIASIDPKTLFTEDPKYNYPYPGYSKNLILFHITETPELAVYNKCRFWIVDSYNSRKFMPVLHIFKFRGTEALQQGCFKYDKCSTSSYSDYKSCDLVDYHKPGSQCQGGSRYYGEFTGQYHQTFACAALGAKSPGTPRPGTQNDTFACVVCDGADDPAWPPSNDVPFQQGSRGSECATYKDYAKEQNGLCIPTSNASSEIAEPTRPRP